MILQTLKTNWRDIVTAVVTVLGVAFLADVLEKLTTTSAGTVWLANVVGVLKGLPDFAAANLAAWFMLSVAWPTLNHYSNDSFTEGWQAIGEKGRFIVFTAVACVEIVAASICFAS